MSQFNIWLLYIFSCIFQLIISPLLWTILDHFISSLANLGHFISFGPFIGHSTLFGPFLGRSYFGHPVTGQGWSIYQFKISFNLEIKIKSYEEDCRVTVVDLNSAVFIIITAEFREWNKKCDTMSSFL